MKGKKAMEAYDIIYWSFRILFILILMFSFVYLARVFENQFIDSSYPESILFVRYMLYNPNALPYFDSSSGRAYPGIIDLSKMDSAKLNDAMYFGENNDMVAANITLNYTDAENKSQTKQVFYNQGRYENWLPLSNPTFLGRGTVRMYEEEKYVLVQDNAQRYRGFVKFVVLVPRT